jgi:hypothetical protein
MELMQDVRGAQVRSRSRWAEEGECSTAYFFQQEKLYRKHSVIETITKPDGSAATSSHSILAVFRSYYENLFSSAQLDAGDQEYFLNNIDRKLSTDESKSCGGHVTNAECLAALSAMAHNKSPGLQCDPQY